MSAALTEGREARTGLGRGPAGPAESTLGFALGLDAGGEPQELAEPVVLAAILTAVEAERSGLASRLRLQTRETVEAVAPVYWPLAVLRAPSPGLVAVFDATGVWRRTFRHSLLPPIDAIDAALAQPRSPAELRTSLESLRTDMLADPGADVLTVEGFLPVDPPLLPDVLAQGSFVREPQGEHPGFLPSRHEFSWYVGAVDQMRDWLERFDRDVSRLETLRGRVAERLGAALLQVDAEADQVRREGEVQLARARSELVREAERLHGAVVLEVRRETEAIRLGQSAVARGTVEQRTADTLAERSRDRGTDSSPHRSRGRRARDEVRAANRAIRDAIDRLEALHERERAGLVALTGRATAVEHYEAERVASRELFRDELAAAGHALVGAIQGHLAARDQQRRSLEQYFVRPSGLAENSIVWFPLWMAILAGPRGLRTVVFPPMRLRARYDLATTVKGAFGGPMLPLEPRTALFEGALRRTFEDAVATDGWLARTTAEIVRRADVLSDPDLGQRLNSGLAELVRAGWVGEKSARRLGATYDEIVRQRQAVPPPSLGPLLAAAGVPPVDDPPR